MTLSQRINLSHQTPARPLDFIQNGLRFVVVANRFLAVAALIFSVAVFFYFRYYPERQMPAMDRKVMIRQHGQEVRSWGSVSDIGHFSTVRIKWAPS